MTKYFTVTTPDTGKDGSTPPDGGMNGLRNKPGGAGGAGKVKALPSLTPEQLFHLCSEDMQLYVRRYQGDRRYPGVMDFVQASIDRLHDLGINRSAYEAACAEMNDLSVAICIIVIDRNRFHPQTPIRNPGGVLRAMTARQAAGRLNLVGSLIGLIERDRQHE